MKKPDTPHPKFARGGGTNRQLYAALPISKDPNYIEVKKFLSLYFDALDKNRKKIIHLYGSSCRLIFDGNVYDGGEQINEFWQKNFPPSEHVAKCQDYKHFGNELLMLCSSGEVLFEDRCQIYTSSIFCQKQDGMWKIISDNYRLFD